MKTSISIALFALLIVTGIVAVEKYKLSDSAPHPIASNTKKAAYIRNCVYQDNQNESFTLQIIDWNKYILVDGKYKVFFKYTYEEEVMHDTIYVYKNKGYTYDLMQDGGFFGVGVKPNNGARRIAQCKLQSRL